MKLKMLLLSSSLFTLLIFTADANSETAVKKTTGVKCPQNTQLVDFTDPTSKNRTLFCQINKDGKLVKHGAELTFSPNGILIKKEFYNMGINSKGKLDKGVIVDKAIKDE